VYDRTVSAVYSYLASRVRDREVAEELTQDVFLVGAKRCADGEVVDVAWLIGVARHKLVDHWRSQSRNERLMAVTRSSMVTGSFDAEAAPEPGRAAAVLARLNPTYRTALVLRHVDGLCVAEVATHLNRSLEATEQVLSRARAAFRDDYRRLIDE
jgi:RNA polymerase sigma-70 factor (ECF subfamily)